MPMTRRFKPIQAELPSPETIDAGELAGMFRDGITDLICVLGPTASGKTRYAVGLAKRIEELSGLPCEIISADSRQIFRGMDIGTGKDLDEYGDIPYHLIDILPAGARYNVYRFQQDFLEAYRAIRERGAVPILCGGTGLYINAVINAYDFASKTPLSAERDGNVAAEGFPSRTYVIGTLVDRETRNSRIDARLDARLREGMIDEIRSLLDGSSKGCEDGPVDAGTLISYGLEYKFVTLHLLGELSFDEMRVQLATAIHQFAKRQMTWFRGMERSGTRIHWTEA